VLPKEGIIMRNIITATAIALCVILFAAPAFAHNKGDFEGTAVKTYYKSYDSFQFSYYMDKVNAIFFSDEFKAEHPMANFFEALVDAVGYESFEQFDVYEEMTHGEYRMKETIWLNDKAPDSFIYRWLTVPDSGWKFPEFVSDGDYICLMAINNVKEKAPIFMDYMSNIGKAAALMGENEPNMNFGPLGMLQLNDEMSAAIGDEMDLIVFDVKDLSKLNGSCPVNAAIMVPIENYEAVKKMLGMVGGMAGFNVDKPGFSTADWSYYPIPGTTGSAIGLNHDWLVMVSNYKEFMPIAQKAPYKSHQALAKGNTYIRIDMNRLYREVGIPAVTKLKMENPKLAEKEIAFFFDITPNTDLGYITMTEQHHGKSCVSTVTMNDDVYNMFGYIFSLVAEDIAMEQMGLLDSSSG
jgi:hypothetical protein